VRVEGVEASGEVLAIAPSVDPSTGAVTVRIRVKNDGRFRLGQTARAAVMVARRESALAVPERAVVPTPSNGRALVFVSPESKAELREIELGPSAGGWVEVVSGAKEGERFVADAPYAIPDGTPLRAVDADPGDAG
jgi:multidrug efflux pump subunit AcrA (membrane-fusion protein)